jgi:predicted heme/steroid binding protein
VTKETTTLSHETKQPAERQRRTRKRLIKNPDRKKTMASTNTAVKLLSATTASTGLVGAYLWYDYKTCHPMRKIKYEPNEALIRFHNTCVNQLPFLVSTLSLQELQRFNGQGTHPTYFSAAGKVYDVSRSEMFSSTYSQWAGRDATVALAKMSLDPSDISRTDVWKQLSPEDEKSLKSWTYYFDEKYQIKHWLKEYVEEEG